MLGTQDSSSKYSDSQLFMVVFLYSNKNGHGETGIVSIVLVFCFVLFACFHHKTIPRGCEQHVCFFVANTGPKGMFESVCV